MRYLIAFIPAIWPAFLIKEWGFWLVIVILFQYIIGIGVGEWIERQSLKEKYYKGENIIEKYLK